MILYVFKFFRRVYFNYRDFDIGVNYNFIYEEGKGFGEKYFSGNFDRLVKVKFKVDVGNFF